jgi:hypothetical protein
LLQFGHLVNQRLYGFLALGFLMAHAAFPFYLDSRYRSMAHRRSIFATG